VTETTSPRPGDLPEPPEPEHPAAQEAVEAGSWVRRIIVAAIVIVLATQVAVSTLVVIAALIFFIFMHELGHYLTARWAGMKVTEFFIGFGPRLWSFRRGETEYGFKAIPAGAYVKIIGMSNLEDVDPSEEHLTYRQKPYWRRLSVAVAGSTMHFLMAIVLIFSVYSVFGVPDPEAEGWTVGAISALETGPSPAEEAGLQLGDRIVSVDGQRFGNFDAMASHLRERPGEEVTIVVERDGERRTLRTELADRNPGGEPVGFLGVGPEWATTREGPVQGLWEGVRTTGETMVLSVQALGQFFSPDGLGGYIDTLTGTTPAVEPGAIEGENRLLSPVGAVNVAGQAADAGLVNLISFLFLINVFIGVFNLVPLLPFDGGHVVIATYERIRSRGGRRYHADVSKLMPLTYAVVVVLILIGLSALYLDIADPINLPL
jgi:membrane-associated protease RseP (regulator of RpoE activity)